MKDCLNKTADLEIHQLTSIILQYHEELESNLEKYKKRIARIKEINNTILFMIANAPKKARSLLYETDSGEETA